jgi:hypothetical protein
MPSDFDRWLVAQFGPKPRGSIPDARHRASNAALALDKASRNLAAIEQYAEIERVARYAWNAARAK